MFNITGMWRTALLVVLGVCVAQPVFALRPDKSLPAGRMPAMAAVAPPAYEVPAAVLQARKAVAARRADVTVRWDESLGTPTVVHGLDLMEGAQPVPGKTTPELFQNAVAVMDKLGGMYGIRNAAQEFAAQSVASSPGGYQHVRLNQTYNGLPVFGGQVIVHFDAQGMARTVNGAYKPIGALDTTATISADQAVAIAKADQSAMGNPVGTLSGNPELVVFARETEPKLAWQLVLTFSDGLAVVGRWRYWIDAGTGAILLGYNDIPNAAPKPKKFAGVPAIITGNILAGEGGGVTNVQGWTQAGYSYLYSFTNRWYVYNYGSHPSYATDAGDYANRFGTSNWGFSDRAEMSAGRALEGILNYYKTVHGRASFDDRGTLAPANVHYGYNYVNAFWDGSAFYIGDGDGVEANPLGVMDIMAHEFTHGVTEYSANLVYYGESGQLNESFSDIFGFLSEYATQPDGSAAYPGKLSGHWDWLMGEDSWLTSTALRDMRNPTNSTTVGIGNEQPSRYLGKYWYYGGGDNGGVHLNCSIQNYFFYLLSEGGEGSNDNTIAYFVPPVGIPTAAKLAYTTLTGYMTPSTRYAEAREAWMACAQDFDDAGVTTNAAISVGLAWAAVGVGDMALIYPNEPYVVGGEPASSLYLPSNKVYTVVNPSFTNSMTWTAYSNATWLKVEPATLAMSPGEIFGKMTVSVDVAVADAFPKGVYRSQIIFTNNVYTNGVMSGGRRDALMHIASNYFIRGETYNWIDPSASATNLHTVIATSAGQTGPYTLPFPVKFYDSMTNNTLFITTYGAMGFALTNVVVPGRNTFIPNWRMPNALICPLWDAGAANLAGGRVTLGVEGAAPNRRVVVTWMNLPYGADTSARFTYQAIIEESATLNDDNDIVFQYKDVAESNTALGGGSSATIGLEDEFGALGKQFSYNTASLINECAIRFTHHPAPDTNAPTGWIQALGRNGSTVYFLVRFNEPVTPLTAAGLTLAGSTVPGIGISQITGAGFRYRVSVTNATGLGRIMLSVLPGAVNDLAGNPTAGFGPGLYVMPATKVDFGDTMEAGRGGWTVTTQKFSVIDTRGWKVGVPTFLPADLDDVPEAHSPSNCWSVTLDGPTPDSMADARLTSPLIPVGPNPTLDFWMLCGIGAYGFLEVNPGNGWYDVTPEGDYGPYLYETAGEWVHRTVALDNDVFGNCTLQVRFNAFGGTFSSPYAGLYIDDFAMVSDRDPGVWVVGYTPSNGPAATTNSLTLTAYNSTTNTYSGLKGELESPEPGVSFVSGVPIGYGTLLPGGLTNGAPVGMALGSIGNFKNPTIQLSHLARSGLQLLGQQDMPFVVNGVIAAAVSTNTLMAKCALSGVGVTNWLGQYLRGDGGPTSGLFEVIYAGANGIPDPPAVNGQVSGDDKLLYGADYGLPWGAFGEGGVPSDAGQFKKLFKHALPAGARVFVRAFDGPSFSASVAYGNSPLYTLTGLAAQTRDFGPWGVGTPTDYYRDSDGDSIPDGYCLLNGMDPRNNIKPLAPGWNQKATLGSAGSSTGQFAAGTPSPTRVVYRGNFLYVADTGHNKLQVWNRITGTCLGSYGSSGNANGQFSRPYGLGLDPRAGSNRFAVVDQGNFRVQVFGFNPATGMNIDFLFAFGGSNIFTTAKDVAIAPDGRFYVTDDASVKVFSPAGVFQSNLAVFGTNNAAIRWPWGVTVGPDGRVIVADTENHRIQSWNSAGVWQWSAGGYGTNANQLITPRDVAYGPGGLLYVADTGNSRLAIYRTNGTHVASLGAHGFSFDVQMTQPYSLAPVVDSNIVYVADTLNYRILTVTTLFDWDGDGMDDVWEILHGLNPMNPADALGDFNGDGTLNIGEYRLQQDPGMALYITAFSLNPQVLTWESVVTGGVYRLEYNTNSLLDTNAWHFGPVRTSSVTGVMSVTNAIPITNALEFIRVRFVTNSL